MAHGKSVELSNIPKNTPQWVHQHTVPDRRTWDGKTAPGFANRAERRAAGPGPFGARRPTTTPYTKPQED